MSSILHRSLLADPVIARTGRGLVVTGADGHEVIDASGGAAVACIGHGDRRVVEAITRQAEAIAYAHTVFFTCDAAEELADHLGGGGATTGCVTALPGYFPAVRDVCDRYGALLILDEVMCGMGRTGTVHAWEQEGISPDIQTIAKGLGGGYQPIGGILLSDRIATALREGTGAFRHGHTYQAHPVACAAALAVQRIIRDDGLLIQVRSNGADLERKLRDAFSQHVHIGDIRGRGLFWAIEFVENRESRRPFAPALAVNDKVKAAALAEGIAIYPMGGTADGTSGDHIIVAPPFTARPDEIERIVARLERAVGRVFAS